jgi:hypothetical protein
MCVKALNAKRVFSRPFLPFDVMAPVTWPGMPPTTCLAGALLEGSRTSYVIRDEAASRAEP